ncbi:MAG: hypothetical protein WCN95_14660 [bacterium]
MTLQDYTAFDVYVGKWLLDVTYHDDASRDQTRLSVYWQGGVCFVDVMPPDGGSVTCTSMTCGINLSTWSERVCRWSGSVAGHIGSLAGISHHFGFWMPGLLMAPSSVPLAEAVLIDSRRRYAAMKPPHKGKRFVGLVEAGLLVGLKYHVGKVCYVQAKLEFQRLVRFGTKK